MNMAPPKSADTTTAGHSGMQHGSMAGMAGMAATTHDSLATRKPDVHAAPSPRPAGAARKVMRGSKASRKARTKAPVAAPPKKMDDMKGMHGMPPMKP